MSLADYSIEQSARMQEMAESHINEKKGFVLASLSGLLMALLWSYMTWKTGKQASYTAIFLGLLIGRMMWTFGRGMEARFGVYASLLTLGFIVFSNSIAFPFYFMGQYDLSFPEFIQYYRSEWLATYIQRSLEIPDMVLYSLGIFMAFMFSFKDLEKQIQMGIITLNEIPKYVNREPSLLEEKLVKHKKKKK